MTAGEEDKLYGSVTTDLVAEAFASEGVKIDKKQIHLPVFYLLKRIVSRTQNPKNECIP